MTKAEWIEQELNEYGFVKDQMIQKLKKFVVDKSIPLDDRWKIFVNSQLGQRVSFIVNFKSLAPIKYYARNAIEDAYFDDVDKYREIFVEDMLEYFMEPYEKTLYGEYGFIGRTFKISQSYDHKNDIEYVWTLQDTINFQEECLEAFIYSFKMDW